MHPAIEPLVVFVKNNTTRGICQCRSCASLPVGENHPGHPKRMPNGRWYGLAASVNPIDFFQLTAGAVKAGAFSRDGLSYDMFDGHPYNYEDLEGFFGDDRNLTMQFMACGLLLNLFARLSLDHVMFLMGEPAEDKTPETELALATVS